jgi:ribosome-interacting GTPase 1
MAYAERHGIPVADDAAPEILSRHQVSAMVDMPPKTVARWIEEGRLRESRIRWRRGITLDDLLDFCNENGIRMRRVD